MSHLRVGQPAKRAAIDNGAAADAGADRNIHADFLALPRAPPRLGKRRAIDVGVETHR